MATGKKGLCPVCKRMHALREATQRELVRAACNFSSVEAYLEKVGPLMFLEKHNNMHGFPCDGADYKPSAR